LPIGNHEDITIRGLNCLKEKSYFLAEDTRVFKDLLKRLGIEYSQKKIDSFHNDSDFKIKKIIDELKTGNEIVLVSDAGSPVISDPAYPLIKEAVKNNIKIETFPGVTSVIAALELSGLPTTPFFFWGFLGRDLKDKKNMKDKVDYSSGTHVFFESPQRVKESIKYFTKEILQCEIVAIKEITKTFQSVYRISSESDVEAIDERGEFVVLIYKNSSSAKSYNTDLSEMVKDYLEKKTSTKQLAKILAEVSGIDTKEIYKKLINNE